MSIRPFDWRDLPALHRYRNQSVFLHSSLVLTRGPMLLSGAILSALAPSMGINTTVSTRNGDNQTLIGQTIQTPGSQNAQLTFLAPEEALRSIDFSPLLDYLCAQAVDRGAFRLLADVDEDSPVFEAIRQAGFAIYARQRIWRLTRIPAPDPISLPLDSGWRPAEDRDLIGVRSLYYNLIPGLVQQVEPFPSDRLHGFVFCHKDEPQAYVEVRYGHRGIWVQPFVHPDAEDVGVYLGDMLQNLPNRRSRPVYLCVRSYQYWLETSIEALGAEPSPRQAIMVKHLAIPQKQLRAFTLPALEGGRPEISAPISNAHITQATRHVAAQMENER